MLSPHEMLEITYTWSVQHYLFDFLSCRPAAPTASIFMFISQILSVIGADFNVIFSKIVSPDEELSASADGLTLILNTGSENAKGVFFFQ